MAKKIKTLPDFVLREGFFRNEDPMTETLPVAKARDKAWKGKKAFLTMLGDVEQHAAKKTYKGWSTCRCCGEKNGSADIILDMFGMKWVWPSGYSHYVEEHNIRPGLAFQEFIMAAGEELGPGVDDDDVPKPKKAKVKVTKEASPKKKGIIRRKPEEVAAKKAKKAAPKAKTKGVKSPNGKPTKKTAAASSKAKAAKAKAKKKGAK